MLSITKTPQIALITENLRKFNADNENSNLYRQRPVFGPKTHAKLEKLADKFDAAATGEKVTITKFEAKLLLMTTHFVFSILPRHAVTTTETAQVQKAIILAGNTDLALEKLHPYHFEK